MDKKKKKEKNTHTPKKLKDRRGWKIDIARNTSDYWCIQVYKGMVGEGWHQGRVCYTRYTNNKAVKKKKKIGALGMGSGDLSSHMENIGVTKKRGPLQIRALLETAKLLRKVWRPKAAGRNWLSGYLTSMKINNSNNNNHNNNNN